MKKTIFIVFLILISVLLSGCTNVFKPETPTLEEKVDEEIDYIDTEIVSILNSLNNIIYANYKVVPAEVKQTNTASNPNSQMGESKSGGNSEPKESLDSSGESNSKSSSDSETKPETKSSVETLKMEPNTVLDNKNQTIDWTKIKSNIEVLYTAWITSKIDLKEIGVSEEILNEFSNQLNIASIAMKNENKQQSMQGLINMYGIICECVDQYSNNRFKKDVIETKKYILEASNLIDKLEWNEVDIKIGDAEQKFEQVKKYDNIDEYKKADIDRVSVLIKELQYSIKFEDREISLLKYKNLIQEISAL